MRNVVIGAEGPVGQTGGVAMQQAQWDLSGTPAEVYERYMVPAQFRLWAPDLVELVAPRTGERALDVACGTGVVTRLLARAVGPTGTVVGLDVNSGMLAVARSAVPAPNVEWREASALELPFPDGSFDMVLCQQGVQFFADRPKALREFRRVLAPEGRLAIGVWRSTADVPAFGALERSLGRHVGADAAKLPPFALGDARQLRALLTEAGFSDVVVRSEVKMARYPSPETFVRCVVAGVPTMLGPLAEQGDAILQAIVRDVDAELQSYLDDGGLAFPMGNHVVTARR